MSMTKEQEDAIRILEAQASTKVKENHYLIFHKEATVTVLNMLKEKDKEIEKKDKIIDLMAEMLVKVPNNSDSPQTATIVAMLNRNLELKKLEVKQYFEKKVEE